MPVGVDSGRKAETICKEVAREGYTREFVAICVDQEGVSTSKGRGGKGRGKRSGRGRRDTQQGLKAIK